MSVYVRYVPPVLGGGGGGGGGTTAPGGVSGDIQYNAAGSFGGDPNFTTNGTGGLNATSLVLSSTIGASNFSGSSSGTNTGDVTLGTANGLSLTAQALSLGTASTSTTGALTSTDWNTFNNKQATITEGNLTEATSSILTITGGTNAVIGTGTSIQVKQASGSQSGYLSSTDWTTFNSKGAGTVTTIGTIDSEGTPAANGATISGASLILQSASGTVPGLVNISAQTFLGNKTFTNNVSATLVASARSNVGGGFISGTATVFQEPVSGLTNFGYNVSYNGTNWVYLTSDGGAVMQMEASSPQFAFYIVPTGTAGGTATITNAQVYATVNTAGIQTPLRCSRNRCGVRL